MLHLLKSVIHLSNLMSWDFYFYSSIEPFKIFRGHKNTVM